MIKVLKDNTKQEYFTKCASCGSEISYGFKDVQMEEVPHTYIPIRYIKCPVCSKATGAELKAKDDYEFSVLEQLKLASTYNSCCCQK